MVRSHSRMNESRHYRRRQSKLQRNSECTCGSGKKFKHCCGAQKPKPQPIEKVGPQTTSASIQVPGFPGEAGDLHVINQFKAGDPRNDAPLPGSPGQYTVTFVLRRPGYSLTPEGQYSFATGLEGDSHLAITKPAYAPPGNPDADMIKIYGHTEDGKFVFAGRPNKRGFLGKLTSDPFHALNRNDAEHKAYRALASSLSNWAVHLDIPLEICQVDTTELATANVQMSLTKSFWEAPFATTPTAELKAEFRGYASLYREALGSNSAVYRFLCLFKIVEGIRARRTRLAREAKRRGTSVTIPDEVLPKDTNELTKWLNAVFPGQRKWDGLTLESAVPPEVRGQSISTVIEKVLNPIRDNVAHALLSNKGELTMSADESLHIQQVNKWLAMLRCIARRMLKNDFSVEYLRYLREDGSVDPDKW